MENQLQLNLIDGVFLLDEGKEILNNIFSSKINFHQMKNFSSQERFGHDDKMAVKRIPELREELVKLDKILKEATIQQKKLIIRTVVEITVSKEE